MHLKDNNREAHDNHNSHNHHNHKEHNHHKCEVEKQHHHEHGHHHAHMVEDFKKRFWISLIITIPVLILSPMIQGFLGIEQVISFTGELFLLFLLSSIIFMYGGYPFLKGLLDELSDKSPGMMTLIAVAISVAYFYSSAVVFGLSGKVFFWELVTLIDIMLLGHWIEMKSVMGASRALDELAKLMPSKAHRLLDDGSTEDVPLEKIKKSDKIVVKPGEKIPADGFVLEGYSSVNEAMITGESKPVEKVKGDEVIGGSLNSEGSITVSVGKTEDESYLSQVIKMVREAQKSKSKTQNLVDKAALWLTIIALTAGAITLFIWFFIVNMDFVFALERTVTVMVITCPHALGLAVPLVVAVSTAISAKNGLLIRNRNAFENARNIQAIVFDKTGTLTKGEFGVTDVVSFDDKLKNEQILKYAASVESKSEHPIAKGIVAFANDTSPVKDFRSITGKGAEGIVIGKNIKVVSSGYLRENKIELDKSKIEKMTSEGKTVVFVLVDNQLKGAVALADIIRPESKEAIAKLKQKGIRCMMLTGDNEKVARWVANEIELDEYFAEVLPDKKAKKIKDVQKRGLIVAMTGDGVNDAPALAQADIGIAIGAGTDVAVETADIILVKNNPLDAVTIISLAKSTYSKMFQNIVWATGYNVIAIPLAAGVLFSAGIILSPAVGAVLMSLSTVIVAINAKMLKIK